LTVKSMTTTGHVFIPFKREHDGMVPTDGDQPPALGAVPTMPFQAPVGEGQIDREEVFWFEAESIFDGHRDDMRSIVTIRNPR